MSKYIASQKKFAKTILQNKNEKKKILFFSLSPTFLSPKQYPLWSQMKLVSHNEYYADAK